MVKLEIQTLRRTVSPFDQYHCYLDDILCVTQKQIDLMKATKEIKAAHLAIGFTWEIE